MVEEIIHEHDHHRETNNMLPLIIFLAIFVALIFVVIYYGRGIVKSTNPEINIPDKIDVNVNSK